MTTRTVETDRDVEDFWKIIPKEFALPIADTDGRCRDCAK
jgi:hypothetical protein